MSETKEPQFDDNLIREHHRVHETKEQVKHTPGPWIRQQYTIKRIDGRVLAKCNVEHNDENDANARLIATAPELLEACKRAIQLLKGAGANVDEKEPILAAIAKAEGRND